MMNNQKNDLKEILMNVLESPQLAAGGRQIVCRCRLPGCDDTKRHLYIGPFDDSDSPVMYNCFKCNQFNKPGIVNKNFLEMYGINDDEIGRAVGELNKGPKYRSYTKSKDYVYRIQNEYITDSQVTRQKLQYINQRLGLNFNYKDCIDNKIVLNINDLLSYNKIFNVTRHPNIVSQLNDNFIGFLSRSNSSLNMRNLNPGNVYEGIDKKYVNYKIFPDTPKNDYYILPDVIDIDKHLKVYIGEGPFDILSIKYNVVKPNPDDNCIFIAGKGKAYYEIVEYLLLTYGIYDAEIHFYPDRDVSDKYMYNIIRYLSVFGFDFYMHRNGYSGEKDFGVPIDHIKDLVRYMK